MYFFRISLICALLFCGALAGGPCDDGYGMNSPDEGCQICMPGTYDSGYDYCESCQPDTYQPEAGQMECLPCPPDTNSLWGATECISCPEGHVLMDNNECGTCPPGQYLDYRYCSTCSPGFFKAEAGIGPCLPCPRNAYSRPGASECVSCPEGEALMTDGSCGTCPPGKYYDPYNLECAACYPGTYTDSPNILRNCYQCGGHSFSSEGASTCIECPDGEVFFNSSQPCGTCEPGHHYDPYELSCVECPYGTFSVYENQLYCEYCMSGSFSRRASTTCFACPHGQVYLAETDECGVCPPEEYYHSYEARCTSYDYYYASPDPEEPTEEPYFTPDPLFELPVETPEEEPTVSDVPIWEFGVEPEY